VQDILELIAVERIITGLFPMDQEESDLSGDRVIGRDTYL
jgi:hypothetical protein